MSDSFLSRGLQSHYILGTRLGKGTFGEVRRIVSKVSGRSYAVKKISRKSIQDSYTVNEIHILMSISHPFIVQFVKMEKTPEFYFVVMELANRGTLHDGVINRKFPTEDIMRYYFCQVVFAVQYLHKKNIMHRDLKPANILMHKDTKACYKLKVSDFGVSKMCIQSRHHTQCGTTDFMAPEVLAGCTYSYKADVWSLGVILYFMLSLGRLPHRDARTPRVNTATENANDLLTSILIVDQTQRKDANNILLHSWIGSHTIAKVNAKRDD